MKQRFARFLHDYGDWIGVQKWVETICIKEKEMVIANRKSSLDKRIHERRPYSGPIFFVAKDGFTEGRLKNYSRSGLFIVTKNRLCIGEIITVAIPLANDELIKCRGQILRQDKDG
jgi:hypothetical protein